MSIPFPWVSADATVKVRVALVLPAPVTLFDSVRVPVPAPDSTVVPLGIPGPDTASPATMSDGNVVPSGAPEEIVTLGELVVVVTSTISSFGPRLVSWPQSLIWLSGAAAELAAQKIL